MDCFLTLVEVFFAEYFIFYKLKLFIKIVFNYWLHFLDIDVIIICLTHINLNLIDLILPVLKHTEIYTEVRETMKINIDTLRFLHDVVSLFRIKNIHTFDDNE